MFPLEPPHDGAMDSSDASNVYITGLDEATTYTFYGWTTNPQESENSADASATTVQNIPDSPDISLNDVLYFHDCAHGDGHAADKNVTSFDVSGNPTVPWIVRMLPMSTSRTGRSYNIYFLWLDNKSANQRKLGGCNHTEYSDSPDISLNDVSFTSMTAHMETVYAADKNVTSFDVSWEPHDGAG
jgi:hypothetical protein